MRALPILALALFSGCVFNNVSAEEKLRDSVVGLNEEIRWNRLDLATARVAPEFRGEFRRTHADWHRGFELADHEIIDVQTAGEDRERATSFVTFRWYDMRTMLLAETTVKQEWRRTINGYWLISEAVTDGNSRLLEIPERLRAEEPEEGEPTEETTSSEEDAASARRTTETSTTVASLD
ncbi:MAG: hypothetical protein MUE69_01230 [Myxococcota bacterium]|jgi:hypothetical protein|nr:hypothetical protein [Myxococcota bacterium]